MDCPRCNDEMTPLERSDVALQRCTNDNSVFMDGADLNRLLVHNVLPILDRLGGKADLEELAVLCPVCQVDMTVVLGGNEKAYETCESCGGVWLDLDEDVDPEDFGGVEPVIVEHFKQFKD